MPRLIALCLLLLWLVGPVQAAPPAPVATSFSKVVATVDSIPDGSRLTMEVTLNLQDGLRSSSFKPGYSQVTLSGPDGRGSFENASLRVNDPLVAQLSEIKVAHPARITAQKQVDSFNMAWLLLEAVELLPLPPAPDPEGGAVVSLSLPIRLTHRLDGTPYPKPVIMRPNPQGEGMIDEEGEVFGGVKVSWSQPRPVEIEVEGRWVPVLLGAPGAW